MIGKKMFFFVLAVFVGLGAADRQVRELRDAETELMIYGWRTQENTADIVWMGDVYPAVSWNEDGDLVVEAGGLDFNLTDGSQAALEMTKVGVQEGIARLRSLWYE